MDIKLEKENKIKLVILFVLMFIVLFGGISYAYFGINIIGNEEASSNSITTLTNALGYLRYTDAEIITDDMVLPGWTESKTVTVENTGSTTVKYKLLWRNLLNEFINDEIKMSISCSSTSGTCLGMAETSVATFLSEVNDIVVRNGIEIESGVTHTYTITFSWIETGSNQSYNKNKKFKGLINVDEFQPPIRTGNTYEGMPVVRIGTEEFYDITNAVNYSSLDSSFKDLIDYDASKSILLARYNLDKTTGIQTTSTTQSDYAVRFSGTNYWYDSTNDAIKSDYGIAWDTNNIYDTTYSGAPASSNPTNADYSVAYYVENYVSNLGVDAEGRLLTYPEANAMTKNQRKNGQEYWLGSANNGNRVQAVTYNGFDNYYFNNTSYYGVRPVLVVDAASIQ